MVKIHMLTVQKGNIGLGLAIAYFCKKGLLVSLPLNDITDYDLIYDKNSTLRRVSVKYTSEKTPIGEFRCGLTTQAYTRTSQGPKKKPFNPLHVEDVVIVTEKLSIYLIPSNSIDNTVSITLNPNRSQFLVEGSYHIDINNSCECGSPIAITSTKCKSCMGRLVGSLTPTKINWPLTTELKGLVQEKGFEGTARYLSSINEKTITGNSIRKRIKNHS